MKITMDGNYAFPDKPTEKVRILCVDAPSRNPVVYLMEDGMTARCDRKGFWQPTIVNRPMKVLQPLEEPLLEL